MVLEASMSIFIGDPELVGEEHQEAIVKLRGHKGECQGR